MKVILPFLMTLATMLIGISALAMADTYYVIPGDDVQAAIDAANPGDTIVFTLGTYSPSSTLNVNKSLTLTSEDPYAAIKPLIDGVGVLSTIIYVAADDVTLDGLEIANGTGDLVKSDSPPVARVTVRNCVVHGSTGDDGVQLKWSTDSLYECCVAYDVRQDGFNMAYSSDGIIRNCEIFESDSDNAAIYVYYSEAMTIECNYIHENTAANGILVYKMGDSGTTYVSNNLIVDNTFIGKKYAEDGSAIQLYVPFDEVNVDAELYAEHNTVDGNTGTGKYGDTTGHGIYWGQKYVDGAPIYMLDNIISNSGGWGVKTELLEAGFNPSGEIDYNDIWNNILGSISNAFTGVTIGFNNISADPLYNPDYTLQGGSPCLGAASDGSDMGVLFGECGECGPPVREVSIDVKPQSCPNPLNVKNNRHARCGRKKNGCFDRSKRRGSRHRRLCSHKGKGVLPVAILGTEHFDVTLIDPYSIHLEGVSPLRWNLEDVATPFEPFTGKEDCFEDCTTEGKDGFVDLTLTFDKQEIVAALGEVSDRECLVVTLTGSLIDGTPIVGEDVVLILKKGKK